VRVQPLPLRESQKVRLHRLLPKSIVKEGDEVVLPLAVSNAGALAAGRAGVDGTQLLDALLTLLREVVPPETAPVPSAVP
jgi:hypothetical protein